MLRKASRTLLLSAVCAAAAPIAARADDATAAMPSAHARISFERVRFPGDGPRVGLIGTSYLVDVPKVEGLSIGPAVYGAITGGRGGFFTVGGEVAWRRALYGPFGVELGFYAGGGGGASAPQGGGLMLRPHADLVWDLGSYALGLSLSRVQFPNGQIDGTQLGLVVNFVNDFRHVPASQLDQPARASGRSGFGFDRIQLVAGAYRPRTGTRLVDGRAAPGTIGFLGARAEQAFASNAYWGVEANGAAQSTVAGYAEYLGTLGVEIELVPRSLTIGGRVAAGMAGGGAINTSGGLLAKAAAYGIYRLSNDFGIALEVGITDAPRGDFRALHASAGLVWALDGPADSGITVRPTRTDFGAGVERYTAARRDGSQRVLQADILRINRYVGSHLYLTGQVHSAVSGGAGGYTAAYLGAGWLQPLGAGLLAGAELIAGAAGGGGVESRGSIVQPTAYLAYQVTPSTALRLGVGRISALRGPLSSTVVDLSLVFSYGVAAGN
ncbi:MAG: hypothetical protein ABI641_15720 [Caldimonas sp.]